MRMQKTIQENQSQYIFWKVKGMELPDVSIVISTYNEEKRILKTLNELLPYLTRKHVDYEIIISDGGSTDGTNATIPKFERLRIIRSSVFLPKGEALIRGALRARGQKILFLDADLPISKDDMLRLFKNTKDNTMIVASRYHPLSRGHCPTIRLFLGKLFNLLVRIILGIEMYDTQCGAKCLSGKLAHKILREIRNKDYAFDIELILRVLNNRGIVQEIPVTWTHKPGSKIKIPKVAFELFIDVLKLRRMRARIC